MLEGTRPEPQDGRGSCHYLPEAVKQQSKPTNASKMQGEDKISESGCRTPYSSWQWQRAQIRAVQCVLYTLCHHCSNTRTQMEGVYKPLWQFQRISLSTESSTKTLGLYSVYLLNFFMFLILHFYYALQNIGLWKIWKLNFQKWSSPQTVDWQATVSSTTHMSFFRLRGFANIPITRLCVTSVSLMYQITC